MPPVSPLNLRLDAMGDDVPQWAELVFQQLNSWSADVGRALSVVTESARLNDKTFTSDASGTADVDMKNPLDSKPVGVVVSKFNTDNGAAITAAYAYTWAVASDRIRIHFVDLAASTKYRFSVSIT